MAEGARVTVLADQRQRLIVAAVLCCCICVFGAEPPTYDVKRAPSPIVIDGKLDDAAWKAAGVITFQFPWNSQSGAKQKTSARLLWDDDFLYVGYDCEDTDITAHFENRDDPTYKDDAVEIFINPKPSQPNYYGLEMNARGVLYDYFMVFGTGLLRQFDLQGVHLATHVRGTLNVSGDQDQGWSLEVAIPWKNFDGLSAAVPPPAGTVWTANLNRWDGTEPDRRLSQWSNAEMPTPNPHNPARFGKLVFVK